MTRREERAAGIEAAGAAASSATSSTPGADRDRRGGEARGRRPRAHGAAGEARRAQEGRLRRQQPDPHRGHAATWSAAAQAAGARRMVAQSIAFVYAPVGGPVKSEDDPVMDAAGSTAARSRRRWSSSSACLRPRDSRGWCCATDSSTGPAARTRPADTRPKRCAGAASRSSAAVTGVFSFVHVDDAAAATVAACERGEPGVYNVCDDEPGTGPRDWLAGLRAGGRREAAAAGAGMAGRAHGRGQGGGGASPPRCAGPRTRRPSGSLGWEPRVGRAGGRASSRRSDKF